jgi:hypothetical protein
MCWGCDFQSELLAEVSFSLNLAFFYWLPREKGLGGRSMGAA